MGPVALLSPVLFTVQDSHMAVGFLGLLSGITKFKASRSLVGVDPKLLSQ